MAQLFGDEAKKLAKEGKAAVIDALNQFQDSAFSGSMKKLGKNAVKFARRSARLCKRFADGAF